MSDTCWARMSVVDYWALRDGITPAGSAMLGALRAMLVRTTRGEGVNLSQYMRHPERDVTDEDKRLRKVVGSAMSLGSLSIVGPYWNFGDEILLPPPADLRQDTPSRFSRLSVVTIPTGCGMRRLGSSVLSTSDTTSEVEHEHWLSSTTLERYLIGDATVTARRARPAEVHSWVSVPLHLDGESRGTARRGLLFESPRVHARPDRLDDLAFGDPASLVVGLRGISPDLVPRSATCFLGGDGKLAHFSLLSDDEVPAHWGVLTAALPSLEYAVKKSITRRRRMRLVVTTRSVWDSGGTEPTNLLDTVRRSLGAEDRQVQLIAAAHGRYEVIGGWDLAAGGVAPRPGCAAVPAGAAYVVEIAADLRVGDDQVRQLFRDVHGRCHSSQQVSAGLGHTLVAAAH